MLNIDATLLRIVVVVATLFSGGTVILIYVLASLVTPKEPLYDSPYAHSPYHSPYKAMPQHETVSPNIDEMMKDIEKKAMWKEIEQLRAKLAQYEKGEV